MKHILLYSFFIISLSGCAKSIRSDFTIISGKNFNATDFNLSKSEKKGYANNETCHNTVLMIPLDKTVTLDTVLDKALESQRGNVLLNAVAEYRWFDTLWPLYSQDCWNINGVAYDTFK